MKRWKIIAAACVVLAVCIAAGLHFLRLDRLALPMEEKDIQTVTMRHFIIPDKAQEKTTEDPEMIGRIYDTLRKLSIREGTSELLSGGEVLQFEIVCKDGTAFVLNTAQIQEGTQLTLSDDTNYTTHDAVLYLWYENDIAAKLAA